MMMLLLFLTDRYEDGQFFGVLASFQAHQKQSYCGFYLPLHGLYPAKNAPYLLKYPATIASIVVHPRP